MLPEDLVVEEVYDKHNGGLEERRQKGIKPTGHDNVPHVNTNTRPMPCSIIVTVITFNGQPHWVVIKFPNMSGATHVRIPRTSSTRTSKVRPAPIVTLFTVIGLQYLFVQDTWWLPAWTAMAMAAMSANMRAIFTPEAMDEVCWK